MKQLIFFLLVPFLLNSQSEGGFGYRRFSNTTTLNNVAPSNINTSHSRNAYVHSNGLYYVWDGNSWEREHDIDTLSISGTDLFISLYGDGVPAKTVDLSTATGFGVNIFNSDGVQTDPERYFDVNDSQILGIGEFPNFPVLNLDGTEKGYFYDPVSYGTIVLDGDGAGGVSQIYVSTVESKISYNNSGVENSIVTNPTGIEVQSSGGNDISIVSDEISFSHYNNSILNINFLNSTKMNVDSLYEFSLGRFPNFPSAPTAYSSYGIHMDGDGFTGKRMRILGKKYDNLGYSQIQARASIVEMEAVSRASTASAANNYFFAGIGTAFYQILFNDDALYSETRIGALKVTPGAGNPGGFRDFSYMYQGTGKDGADTLAISMFLGVPQSTDTTSASEFAYGNFRGWALQSHVRPGALTDSEAYNWIEARMGHTWADTTSNSVGFYKSKSGGKGYYFPNATPGVDCDSCVWVTTGITSSSSHTFLMDKSAFGGSSVNIYNSDGTQDDADRYFTIDSSRTFAMGQFNSFPASTWGRGFYYDPSNNDGIRILNKDGSNTSTTKVELDPFGITIHSDFSNSDATHTFSGLSESANQVLSVDRTSDTYGAISIAEVTNTNEEIVALVQNGKGTTPNVSMYLGDGYSSSQYAKYAERAWGVQSHVTSGSFDWIQVLLPDTGTDTTGNNLNFYNRKYYWVNTVPSPTVGDSSVHIWVGNGTTTTPLFVPFSTITAGAPNIYNSNGTTTDNTRTATITESIQWVGTADLGVDAYPFQIHSTGNEPLIQLWKGNTDSTYLYQSDVEYVFGSSTRLVIWPQRDLTIIADSTAIQGVEDVTKVRRLMGVAASGYLKAVDGDALTAGDFLVSDGTDWTVGNINDYVENFPQVLRPSQLTAKTDNWNPTGYSTTKKQTIELSGDGSFRFITGLEAATRDGIEKVLSNNDTNCVGIAKQHTDSDAENRFDINKDVILFPNMEATFRYDSVGQRWKLFSSSEASISYAAKYDVKATDFGSVTSDNFYYDGQNAGGSIARLSAGSVTGDKLSTTYFTTSTAATASPCLISYSGVANLTAVAYIRTYARVRFEDLSTAAEDYDFTFGYLAYSGIDTTARTKRGFALTYTHSENSGSFSLWSHNGTTGTSAGIGSAIAADTWYNLELVYYPHGEVATWINGTRYSTTTTVPTTGVLSYMQMLDKDNGTTASIQYFTSLEDRVILVSE